MSTDTNRNNNANIVSQTIKGCEYYCSINCRIMAILKGMAFQVLLTRYINLERISGLWMQDVNVSVNFQLAQIKTMLILF